MVKPHQRKDGRWYTSIYLGKNIFNKNKYKIIYGKSYEDCFKKTVDFLYKKNNNLIEKKNNNEIDIREKYFVQAFEEYIDEKVKNNKITIRTKDDYLGCINKNLKDFKYIKIKDLNLEMFKIAIKKIQKNDGEKLVNRVYKIIKPFLTKLANTKKIEYNYLDEIILPKVTVTKHAKCDEKTLEILINLIKKEPKKEYLYGVILICSLCGTRISETLALDYKKSFDFDKKVLSIFQQQVKAKGEGYVIEHTTKSENGKRCIPLHDVLIREIKQIYSKQELYFKLRNIQKDPRHESLLFLNNRGEMIKENTAHRHWREFIAKYKDEYNINGEITFHSFRRYFATWLMKNGVPDNVAKNFLGHANIEMTQYYQDEDMDYNLKEFNKVNLTLNI